MAIYTRFGSEVKLLAYCGKHLPSKLYGNPLMLVRVRYEDDGSEGYQFATFLRAEGGANEIEKVIDGLPEVTLTEKELKQAIKDAQ